ncbi:thymidylate synthase [Halopelagius inordinatus]|uniref:Thymidylate synthase n=1 Tax=Halopelagius inordinatus TaxID=553467 RepID=A0A1I2WZT2_9EURY|nr:thymidylate synthase [Halopelagius inordinatus]SFH06810.1 thymidylate synthase [Halopelagius inordinatus]
MKQYLDLVTDVLAEGQHKPNRTGVDTVSAFSQHYEIDLDSGFPLLTTKDLSGFRWNSLIHEFVWYLSGEEHIRTLREETGIWNAWADDEGRLDTAYGRFWRRFPVPEEGLPGEAWPEDDHRWMNDDERTFDQIQYVVDQLRENPTSRRLVVNAWHPANAAVSTLPPCHYSFVFNVQGDRLNLHLTQRSGDVALGIPFNIAAYSLLLTAVAQRTGFEPGTFAHTVVDAHVYCGEGERGAWYADHLSELQSRLADVSDRSDYLDVRDWVVAAAPDEPEDAEDYDHVPGLLEQCSRTPRERPTIEVAEKPLDELTYDDIRLREYDPADGIRFAVAE